MDGHTSINLGGDNFQTVSSGGVVEYGQPRPGHVPIGDGGMDEAPEKIQKYDDSENVALMEGVQDFVPMTEFWENKGHRSRDELKVKGQPSWYKDFASQIDDDMSGTFDVEETMVGIFWLLSLVPDGESPEEKRGNDHCTAPNNVVEALHFLKPTFKFQIDEDLEKGAEEKQFSPPQQKDTPEQGDEEKPKKQRLKKDYALFGKQLDYAISLCVRQRMMEKREVNVQRRKRRAQEKERLLDHAGDAGGHEGPHGGGGGGGGRKRMGGGGGGKMQAKQAKRAQRKIRWITREVQKILTGWAKAHLPSTGDKLTNILHNIGFLAITPFHTFYEDIVGWKEDLTDSGMDGDDDEEGTSTCKLVCMWLPYIIVKDLLFAAYYYAMVFNFIWYHADIYGENGVTISFLEAWMPLIFVVLVDFLFVHANHYETFEDEERGFSDYLREMSLVTVQPFDRRQKARQVSVVTICKDLETAYKYHQTSWIDFSHIAWWQRILAVLISFVYAIIPGAWRVAVNEDTDTSSFSDFFGESPTLGLSQVPVVVVNIFVAFPAFCFLLLQLFNMNIDFANQLRQVKALSSFTSSKTARKFEKREEAFDNTYMPLNSGANIQGFMVSREIIREEGVPDGTEQVVPPILLLVIVFSVALIVKVFVDGTVDIFVILAAYLVVIFLLFVIVAVLSVAQANTELKEGHLNLLLTSTKALNQEAQDELDRVKAARRIDEQRQIRQKKLQAQKERKKALEDSGMGDDEKPKEEEKVEDVKKQQAEFKRLAEQAYGSLELDFVRKSEIEVNRDCLEVAIMEIQNLNEPIKFLGVEVDMALLFQLVSVGGAGAASSVASLLSEGSEGL